MPVGAYVAIGIVVYLIGALVSLAVAKHNRWGPFDRHNNEEARFGYTVLLVFRYPCVGIYTGTVWALAAHRDRRFRRERHKERVQEEEQAAHRAKVLADLSREMELIATLSPLAGRLALESIRNRIVAEGIHNSDIDKMIRAQHRELERKGT